MEGKRDTEAERAFHRAMVVLYETAKRDLGYNAVRFIQMVSEVGGVEAARRLVSAPDPSDGFTKLWEMKRLDLSVEAHALRPEFRHLFTSSEIEASETRLEAYGYHPPVD